jgi:hypothetical protein
MKKCKWIFVVFVAVSFYACQKKADTINTSAYYIKAGFNGTEKLFLNNVSATDFYGDITADFIMTAKNNMNNNATTLVIQHAFDTTVIKGVYVPDLNNRYFNPGGSYVNSDSIFYGSGGGPNPLIKITI